MMFIMYFNQICKKYFQVDMYKPFFFLMRLLANLKLYRLHALPWYWTVVN